MDLSGLPAIAIALLACLAGLVVTAVWTDVRSRRIPNWLCGANAVLGVRFDSSDMGNGLAEILAYGTAVKVSSLD